MPGHFFINTKFWKLTNRERFFSTIKSTIGFVVMMAFITVFGGVNRAFTLIFGAIGLLAGVIQAAYHYYRWQSEENAGRQS
jgi:hypothetical protein